KSFLGHKVRQVRVTIRAGYQVLLQDPRSGDSRRRRVLPPPAAKADSVIEPPDWAPNGETIVRCRKEGIELSLRELCIRGSCLWFGLEWKNRSPIVFAPAYMRWTIRDRR